MVQAGNPSEPGAIVTEDGVNFAVFSAAAERIELCLFDDSDRETARHELHRHTDGTWHGFLPGCAEGQRYGYRAHGEWSPAEGLRFNPAKLLIDPYARVLSGPVKWSSAVYDHVTPVTAADTELVISDLDSAACMPRSVVAADLPPLTAEHPRIPWSDMIIYETNVRGYTMRHPDVGEADRGRFAGMRNGEILEYLQALGITSVELMPVFEFVDEAFLDAKGLRNYWGYNTLSFFAPALRYAQSDPRREFREMVDALHDAGFEVILDVAYNHTAESGATGPTFCYRGLDNERYYRLEPDDPAAYVNDTGTGNTVNTDHAEVRKLIIDSLRYWASVMGTDGFRFDLGPVLGRTADGYTRDHPIFAEMHADPVLRNAKLIAEPWDPGPGGYQLGNFPSAWAEWNDRYRDSVRRFWRGDSGEAAEFARRLHGSSDIFERKGRGPCASINFITAHDGFSLTDLVSYERRHNEANGEKNKDGHAHNYSDNHGVEGETDDADINLIRRQQRLNLLATLLLSQGTPMLLAGDEIGNSQAGNNNVYAQDNETGWVDWSGRDDDPAFLLALRALIDLRRDIPLFRQPSYLHGDAVNAVGWGNIQWLRHDGQLMGGNDWAEARCMSVVLAHTGDSPSGSAPAVVLLINGEHDEARFALPDAGKNREWEIRFVSAARDFRPLAGNRWVVPGRCIVCVALADA